MERHGRNDNVFDNGARHGAFCDVRYRIVASLATLPSRDSSGNYKLHASRLGVSVSPASPGTGLSRGTESEKHPTWTLLRRVDAVVSFRSKNRVLKFPRGAYPQAILA